MIFCNHPHRHHDDAGDRRVDAPNRAVFQRFDIAVSVLVAPDIAKRPAETRIVHMQQRMPLHHVVHFLHRGTHILQILRDLNGVDDRGEPLRDGSAQIWVKSDHAQVKSLARLADTSLNIVIIVHRAGTQCQKSGARPVPIRNMVPFFSFINRCFRSPDAIGPDHGGVEPRLWRKEQYQRCQISARRQVDASVADHAVQLMQEFLSRGLLARSPLRFVIQIE